MSDSKRISNILVGFIALSGTFTKLRTILILRTRARTHKGFFLILEQPQVKCEKSILAAFTVQYNCSLLTYIFIQFIWFVFKAYTWGTDKHSNSEKQWSRLKSQIWVIKTTRKQWPGSVTHTRISNVQAFTDGKEIYLRSVIGKWTQLPLLSERFLPEKDTTAKTNCG